MKRTLVLALALGCGDEPEPIVDTSEPLVEDDLDPSCEDIGDTWEATGLDVVAVDGTASQALGADALLLEFSDDGTFTSAHLTADGLTQLGGTWQVQGDERALVDPFLSGLTEPVTLTCRREGDRLSLYGTAPFVFEGDVAQDAQILVTLARVPRGAPR